MKAIAEFRIRERYAKEFFPKDLGKNIMDLARIVRVPVGSEGYKKICKDYELVRKRDNDYLFLGWDIQREYTIDELSSADILHLKINKAFEPAGAECGTIYSSTNICNKCGSGSQQVSDLILDLNTVPRRVDIARTISNEIVISQKLADSLFDAKVTGFELKPVHHKSQSYNKNKWFQLVVTSYVTVNPITKTGNNPFDNDIKNNYRCPNGHTIGLDILSELSIDKSSWDGCDISATKQLLGVNRGLLRAYSLLVISHRLYYLMKELKFNGFSVEVAHLVD